MSENVEMYLVSLYRMAEEFRDKTVPIPALAERLNILPVSTNQMVRKLEETGLVQYIPYKGVQLTVEGRKIAAQIRRQHQLWESFLVDCLHFPQETGHNLACRFEHIMSDDQIEHLAALLGNPASVLDAMGLRTSPQKFTYEEEFSLDQLSVDQSGSVTGITADQAARSFLSATGVQPGVKLTALARADSGDVLVRVNVHGTIHLSAEVAAHIWLRKV